MGYLMIVLGAYCIGSSNMAFYLSKLKHLDLRTHGSHNLGASNATILLGWPSGIAVGIHDIGKAVLAVLLTKFAFPELAYAGVVAGVACVLGHIFPFYLKFRGGKGLAPYLGMTLALNWKFALVVLALVVIVTLLTDHIVMGTFTAIIIVPVWMGIATRGVITPLILLIATCVMFLKHRENIARLRSGTEVGLRSTAKGEYRMK